MLPLSKFTFACYLFITQVGIQDSTIQNYFDKKQYDQVIDIFENQISNENNHLDLIGKSYYFKEDYSNAIKILNEALHLKVNEGLFTESYALTYYISRSFLNLYELDSAVHYRELGLKYAEKTDNSITISSAMNNLAVLYQRKANYPKALVLYEKAGELNKDDSVFVMKARGNIADVYYKLGILDSAIQIVSDVYEFFKVRPDEEYWRWLSTYRLAYIEEDYNNIFAPIYYRELFQISDNDFDKGLALVGLSGSYLEKGNDSSFYFLNQAESLVEKTKNLILSREVHFIKTRIFLDHKPDSENLFKSLKVLDSLHLKNIDRRSESTLRVIESKYYLRENDFRNSLNAIEQAIRISTQYGNKDRLFEALEQKFKLLQHFGRYKEALTVKEEEIKVQEELFNERSEAVYQILRTQNEMDKQESTIANQRLVIDNNNLQIMIQYISIALVFIALGFIFWQYRTRSKYANKLETMFLDSRHRYMNNLLLLKNWFNEGKTEKNDEIISFAQNRIDAISTVNRHLDRLSYNKDTIESKSFLEDISHNLLANREFTSEIEDLPINMSVSGPLGMITNEIITNGLKYGEEPYAIRFHKNGGGYILEIEDNGPGIENPEKQGTGSRVLRLLSKQLKGELIYHNKSDLSPEKRGTRVTLTFKG